MAKKIEFGDLAIDDIRQINNSLLQDLVSVARASDVGFADLKASDHIQGGWSRGGDHIQGGWSRGALQRELPTLVDVPGLETKQK